jgi:hypothetical protein
MKGFARKLGLGSAGFSLRIALVRACLKSPVPTILGVLDAIPEGGDNRQWKPYIITMETGPRDCVLVVDDEPEVDEVI